MFGRYPQAYFVSFLIHGAVIALVVLLGFYVGEHQAEPTKVFELVAGKGDNYGATEAPALGIAGGVGITTVDAPVAPQPRPIEPIKVDIAQPIVEPTPTPPQPTPPEPPVAVEPVPVPVPTPTPTPTPKPKPPVKTPVKKTIQTDFKKLVQRTADRKAARLEAQYKKQEAAQKKRESYEQFQKEHGARATGEGISGGVVGGNPSNKVGGAGGKALTREQQSLLDSYFAMFKARLKENHLPPPGVSDRLEARVEFFMSADGSISRVRILRSSGNAEFDQSVLQAFAHTRMPSRPDHHSDIKEMTFKMHDEDAG